MRPFIVGALVLAAVSAMARAPASASDRHPWCMIVQDRDDGWACGFDTLAQCLAEARAGNTGYCAANPSYHAPEQAKPSNNRRKTR